MALTPTLHPYQQNVLGGAALSTHIARGSASFQVCILNYGPELGITASAFTDGGWKLIDSQVEHIITPSQAATFFVADY